jgi:hypothetical protein
MYWRMEHNKKEAEKNTFLIVLLTLTTFNYTLRANICYGEGL